MLFSLTTGLNFFEAIQKPFFLYHGKIITLTSSLPSRKKIEELAIGCFCAFFSPIAYPLLGIMLAIGKIGEHLLKNQAAKQTPYSIIPSPPPPLSKGVLLRIFINKLKDQNSLFWQEYVVKKIKKEREAAPQAELSRIKDTQLISKNQIALLDTSIRSVVRDPQTMLNYFRSNHDWTHVLMCQAAEIRQIYESTHDVFLHAQASHWVAFAHFIKEIVKKREPKINVQYYKFLRNYQQLEKPPKHLLAEIGKFIKDLFKEKEYLDVRDYVAALGSKLDDSEVSVRDKLLSVDAYFPNFAKYESSLYFLKNNSNIVKNIQVVEALFAEVIKEFYKEVKNSKTFSTKLVSIAKKFSANAPVGNLYVICIPKQETNKISYRAHPYGSYCQCHDQQIERGLTNHTIILNQLSDNVLSSNTQCSNPDPHYSWLKTPQYRLFTPLLRPDKDSTNPQNNQRIHLLSPLAPSIKKALKKEIKDVVTQLEMTIREKKKPKR